MAAIGEDDGWNRAAPVLELFHEAKALGVVVDVDPLVGLAVLGQELLGALAVGAPGRPIDLDLSHSAGPPMGQILRVAATSFASIARRAGRVSTPAAPASQKRVLPLRSVPIALNPRRRLQA